MIKIVSGVYKNSPIIFPKKIYKLKNFKPTSQFIKKKIFNWFGNISKLKCLDLFSCSGSLGFEAASRGCNILIMLEKDKKKFFYLKENKKRIGLKNIKIYNYDCLKFLKLNCKKNLWLYDLIFIDSKYIDIKSILLSLNLIYELNNKYDLRIYLETIININILLRHDIFKKLVIVKSDNFNKINFFLLKFYKSFN